MHLRRTTDDIYYFAEKKECDFVVFHLKKLKGLYQVCWQLDQENMEREIAGLTDAMDFFGVEQGYVVTFNQSDTFLLEHKTIVAKPFFEWIKPL